MNTIDFDQTVEFVWNWVAQLHTHLGVQGWGHPHDDKRKRGVSLGARNEIADHLFKMIATTTQPDRVMKALTIQLNFLTTAKNQFHLPHHYFSFSDHGKEKVGDWDSTIFCQALDEDIEELLNTFEYCSILCEKHFIADTASKKKI